MRKRSLLGIFSAVMIITLGFEAILVWMTQRARGFDSFINSMMNNMIGLYALLGALTTGLLAVVITYIAVHRVERQMASRLSVMLTNQLNVPALTDTRRNSLAIGRESAVMLEQLRRRVEQLQGEIARYSAQPVMVGGEQKEDILIQERHRIARELHDSVSQQLFAAMMMLSAMRSTLKKADDDDPLLKQVKTIERVVNSAQSEMRALLLHLRPTNLAGKHLREGIIGLLKELQTKIKIRITWELADVTLAAATEDNLFRIVQELLSNTLRHAEAEELEVYLDESANTVILRVVDDGVGFDTTKSEAAGSYGLGNIKERAAAIGGTARVISFPGQGTSVEVRVPIAKEGKQDD